MSNEKKSSTLGMPHGTATNRLRKILLFSLLKKHGENLCVRCNSLIDRVEDLSIEHLKPWEGISADLFWDLNNIAFSHLKCNRPHSNNGGAVAAGIHGTYAEWYRGCICDLCCQAMRDYKRIP
jgi:hypothetical protein